MKKLSHLDSRGRAHMVDVGSKSVTLRRAVASARVLMDPGTRDRILSGEVEKGDALAVARLAGILGAKQTASLIPLCHPIPLDHLAVSIEPEAPGFWIHVQARTRAATGVEMEAMTGAALAALALIDMVKGVDRTASLGEVRLELKEGGKSGRWVREGFRDPWKTADGGEGPNARRKRPGAGGPRR